MNKIKKLCVFLLMMVVTMSVFAYQLSPLSVTFDPKGAGSAKVYTITNDSGSPIAIQMKPLKRMVDKNGEEYTESANAYFSIQPQKMIIKPGATQLVRVQYRGPQTVTKEMSFRIQAEQIPYSLGASQEDAGQMISFLFVYSTSAYVKPTKVVEKVGADVVREGSDLVVTIANMGSVHQLLSQLEVDIKGNDGSSYSVPSEMLEHIEGANLLTNSEFVIEVPMPEELGGASSFTADVSYKYKYSE